MPKPGARTRVNLVCSPSGGTGKTVTARLLLEHALIGNTAAQGFDTNHLDPDLDRMFPLSTSVVDLSSVRGQMAFFDKLVVADGVPKVVDLWHAAYEPFWAQAASLGFFEEARAQGVEITVFLQADRKDRFLYEAETLPARVEHLALVLVHNTALMQTPASDKGRLGVLGAKRLLIIPAFDADLRRMIEAPGGLAAKFFRAAARENQGDMARHELFKRVLDQLAFLELSLGRV